MRQPRSPISWGTTLEVWLLAFLLAAVRAEARHDWFVHDPTLPFSIPVDDVRLPDMSAVRVTDLASAFRIPFDSPVAEDMIRCAGDVREYRMGVHQGVDFYGFAKGTPVYPVASGIVLRVDRDYAPMSRDYRKKILERCKELGATPGAAATPPDLTYGDILDRLRGRQVWLYHGRNAQGEAVVSLYAHLDSVARLEVGEFVTTDRIISRVGNTGTSAEGMSETNEVHLHLEIHVGERFWVVRRPDEIGKPLPSARDRELRRETLRALNGMPADPFPKPLPLGRD